MGGIGLEFEFPVVDGRGQAATRAQVTEVFRHVAAADGFAAYPAGRPDAPLGAYAQDAEGRTDIGTDYGFCTLEVALPPAPDAASAEAAWLKLLDSVLLPALGSQGLHLLGYGCQPLTRATGRPYVADKPHYELMTRLIERRPAFATQTWPGLASYQFNLDVPSEDVIPLTNALIALSPVILAWSANSPVFGGEVQPWVSLRARAYLEMNADPVFADRFFFPRRPFTGMSDYLRRAWSLPIIEVTRGSAIYRPLDETLTTLGFAARPRAPFVDLDGNVAELACTADDLAVGLASLWPAVRVRAALDRDREPREVVELVRSGEGEAALVDGGKGAFLEIRHLPAMAHDEGFAWLALILGWMARVGELAALVEGCGLDATRRSFDRALVHGWDGELAGRPLAEWGADALAIARDGLGDRPELSGRLDAVEGYLADRRAPGTRAVEVVRAQGVGALVEMSKVM